MTFFRRDITRPSVVDGARLVAALLIWFTAALLFVAFGWSIPLLRGGFR